MIEEETTERSPPPQGGDPAGSGGYPGGGLSELGDRRGGCAGEGWFMGASGEEAGDQGISRGSPLRLEPALPEKPLYFAVTVRSSPRGRRRAGSIHTRE